MSAKFITFEGGEGCGKSTQSRLLADYFKKQDQPYIHTREPGGTASAEEIRKLLVSGDKEKWNGVTEILLHYAARSEHLEKLVKPSLAQGKIVISDRFADSTVAYQGYGHGVDLGIIEQVHSATVGGFSPDLTLVFDIDPAKGLERSNNRLARVAGLVENRYENFELEFHEKVRKGFLAIAEKNPKRCVVINADDEIESIHQKIINIIEERL